MQQLALKVDVDTYRGTREGVPRLVELFRRHAVQATFFFSLGPDHTGRAITRIFRPAFLGKVSRTSMLAHYGIKTLLYGTLLPGPDIGRSCAGIMRTVRDEGFETGIHCYDHVRWQDHVADHGEQWTLREMKRAVDRYTEIFGVAPKAHAAAGWQTNRHALRLTQHFGFDYCSDTRGTHPFVPMWNAEIIACPQLPTTLPTLNELVGRDGMSPDQAAQHVLLLTADPPATGHVYTLHAELEGGKWISAFERMLTSWKEQGYERVSMRQYLENFEGAFPHSEVTTGSVEGRSGTLAVQGS